MEIITSARREFTARYLGDLSKAIFAVALASKLFVDLAGWLRILMALLVVALFLIALFMYPKGEEK